MSLKLAFDFGTTNSVIARWDEVEQRAEILSISALSLTPIEGGPPIIPSLLYIQDGPPNQIMVGQTVRDKGLDLQDGRRLFRNFKRGIVDLKAQESRNLDGRIWSSREAGKAFIQAVLEVVPYERSEIEQLILTAPVESFEIYLDWLEKAVAGFAPEQVRVVDESTAAALGYAVTEPDAVVLVFDFGGGTLDVSLVQLPEHRNKTGGLLRQLRRKLSGRHTARVIAKAGRTIGGIDIDRWLLDHVLQRLNLSPETIGESYEPLLTRCEQVKIALSGAETAELAFQIGGSHHSLTITQSEVEAILTENGFFAALRRVIDKVMVEARRQGIFREDIHYVLLVGGTSLMPSVQALLGDYFTDMAVRADKPFTAVAEGALQVAAGFGLDDYLIHSYGLRHLDAESGSHHYEEIIPAGTRFPTQQPIEILLEAAHPDQTSLEFIIGEIETATASSVEVKYEAGQAVFVATADQAQQHIVPLNEAEALLTLAQLQPPGSPGQDRVKAQFSVDADRHLHVTVIDLQTNQPLLQDVRLATLR